jgi:hypothetical protein
MGSTYFVNNHLIKIHKDDQKNEWMITSSKIPIAGNERTTSEPLNSYRLKEQTKGWLGVRLVRF